MRLPSSVRVLGLLSPLFLLALGCGSSSDGTNEGSSGGGGTAGAGGTESSIGGVTGKNTSAAGGTNTSSRGGANGTEGLGGTGGSGGGAGGSGSGEGGNMSCVATYTECTGLCGDVYDVCTGNTLKCGACTDPSLVCDASVHQCVVPKTTCAEYGAECGRVRNSCGEVLDCGSCGDGLECDPDSNTCVPCSLPTDTAAACAAMGIVCGKAWLGCGPATNLSDCGGCANGQSCNATFNLCEPASSCTPLTVTEACKNKGNECDLVTDGCGGSVDCGDCPSGMACGIAGVANRCTSDVDPTCRDQGRECGTATNACGTSFNCGTCKSTQTCSSAGICEDVCQPKTCDDEEFNGDKGDTCGYNIPNGCGTGKLNCYRCWKSQTDCGGMVDGVGICCSAPTIKDVDSTWECGTVTNECGKYTKKCSDSTKGCNEKTHLCCAIPTVADIDPTWACGTVTNDCGSFTKSCGAGKQCNEKTHTCCDLPTSADLPKGYECGSATNTCGSVWIGCPDSKQQCVNNACVDTCWGAYSGKCGVGLSDGNGGTLNCPCSGAGNVCSATASGVTGTCSCTEKTCLDDFAGQCGTFDNGCGGKVSCECTGFDTCGGGGKSNVCGCTKNSCVGVCGTIDDGCGGTLTCGAC